MNRAKLSSLWEWEHIRNGEIIDIWQENNLVTNQGLNHILDVAFATGTQISTWYVILFENNHTPATGNTYATPGYTESTAYDEITRPAFTPGIVSSQSIDNSDNKATFTISTAKTIYGAALVGGGSAESTKGDTAGGGTLYNVSQFGSSKSVVDDDILRVTVTLTSADA